MLTQVFFFGVYAEKIKSFDSINVVLTGGEMGIRLGEGNILFIVGTGNSITAVVLLALIIVWFIRPNIVLASCEHCAWKSVGIHFCRDRVHACNTRVN